MPEIIVEKRHGKATRAILNGLMAYNLAHSGYVRSKAVTVSLREEGDIVGGARGDLRGPTLFIDLLWIDERFRGLDHGTRLMDAMEAEGKRLGARQVYLDTYSFQARPFYEKRGYTVFGTLANYVEGHDRYWLSKPL
jgi:GNAT superfamily N-acetyltransferase